MNKKEARSVMIEELKPYRAKSYAELEQLISQIDARMVSAPSGKQYQIEIEPFWDGAPNKDIRVGITLSGDWWTYFFPLTEDFIMSPNGQFVRE